MAETWPAVTDVRAGVKYGPTTGEEYTGTLALPGVGDVQTGVQFGAAGTEFTGTFAAPAVGDVQDGVGFGAAGTEFEGTLELPAVGEVLDGVGFGAAGTEFEGTLSVQNNAYSLIIPDSTKIPTYNHVDAMVVASGSSADALAMAKAYSAVDCDDAWDTATIAATAAGVDLEDWTFNVTVTTPAGAELYSETVTGSEGDTLADLAADMVTALEAAGGASLAPSYADGTLTVAAIADGIGTHTVTASVCSPYDDDIAIPGFVGTITDEGIAGAALTVVLVTDNLIPAIVIAAENRE